VSTSVTNSAIAGDGWLRRLMSYFGFAGMPNAVPANQHSAKEAIEATLRRNRAR
jgi:hypothetical protein